MPASLNDRTDVLMAQMDAGRARWLEVVSELVADAIGRTLQEAKFDVTVDIGLTEDETPAGFPYRTVDGETVEAALIAYQLQSALGFAEHQRYLAKEEVQLLMNAVVRRCLPDTAWATSLGAPFAPGFGSTAIALALAHYLVKERKRTSEVAVAFQVIEDQALPFLARLGYLAAATAFDDDATSRELMRSMSSQSS